MLQVFYTNVAKVDRDVAYVAMVVHVFICFLDLCCKCVYLDVAYVPHICYKCFICMLRMFAMVFRCFQVFLQVFQTHVSSIFFYTLQVLHLDIFKVDRVLHMRCAWKTGGGVSGPCLGNVRAARPPHGHAKRRRQRGSTCGRTS
jgi:hypothetical protein